MQTFDLMKRESWFNRLVRHVLCSGEQPNRGRAMDIVARSITTRFNDPDVCLRDEVGNEHEWDIQVLQRGQLEQVFTCEKCGAKNLTRWRPQPSLLRVIAGL